MLDASPTLMLVTSDTTEAPSRRIIAALVDPGPTRRVLDHLGLAADPIPIAPARAPPQHDLWPGGGEFDPADAPA